MAARKRLSNHEFLRRMREYLSMEATVWETDERSEPCSTLFFGDLSPHRFYCFDGEAVLALTHAIEDLALDEAEGSLLAGFPDDQLFESVRERYWQLAATLDDVRVVVTGPKPKRHGRLKFISTQTPALQACWLILFEGRRNQALAMLRETGAKAPLEEKRFIGFYAFDPRLIERIRLEIDQVISGRVDRFYEWERLQALELVRKKLNRLFAQEAHALDSALHKLQTSARKVQTRQFTAEFDKSLARFEQFKSELPQRLGPEAHQAKV